MEAAAGAKAPAAEELANSGFNERLPIALRTSD